jgi:hypothetical protein
VNSRDKILKNWTGRIGILCCLFMAACGVTQAQVKFSASAPKSVAVNQQFQLTFTIENGSAKSLTPPAFGDFQVLAGPSTSQNMSWINGQVSQSVSYTYVLKPKKEGTFKIGKGIANIQGTNVESNELSITVTGAVQQQAQQQRRDPFDPFGQFDPFQDQDQGQEQPQQPQPSGADNQKILKENVFVRLITDKNSIYLGERVTATMRLYFRFGVANFGMPKAPTFDGFWSQEVQMPKEPKRRTEMVNGQQYNVVDIQIYNLYPQKSGTLKITSADINMIVQAPVRSFWGMQYQNMEMKTSSNGVSMIVKDLPAEGKPKDFSGAVGQFSYSARLSSKEGKTDNAITYTMKIAGAGNLKMIELPKPEMPEGFEVFDPKIKDDVSNSANGVSGTKQYDYLVIPRQPGEYKIPASAFSYFDPAVGKYFTLSSPELALKVTGEPSQNPNTNTAAITSKEDVSALHADIRFIKTKPGDLDRGSTPFFGSVGYAGLLATPLLFFIGLIFVKRKNEDLAADIVGAKRRRATKLAKKRLSAADKHLSQNNKPAFYDEVSRALWGYLGDKLNIDQSQLSKDNVEEKLLAKNVKAESIAKLKTLINTCELALYSPVGAGDEMKQNYNAAISLIADLEDEIK